MIVDPEGGDGVRPCVEAVGAESGMVMIALLGDGWSDLGVGVGVAPSFWYISVALPFEALQ